MSVPSAGGRAAPRRGGGARHGPCVTWGPTGGMGGAAARSSRGPHPSGQGFSERFSGYCAAHGDARENPKKATGDDTSLLEAPTAAVCYTVGGGIGPAAGKHLFQGGQKRTFPDTGGRRPNNIFSGWDILGHFGTFQAGR